MKATELFRETLKTLLKDMPRGSQSEIADKIGIGRQHMNSFLQGRKNLSEDKREEIANMLGYSYIEFLLKGRDLIGNEKQVYNSKDLMVLLREDDPFSIHCEKCSRKHGPAKDGRLDYPDLELLGIVIAAMGRLNELFEKHSVSLTESKKSIILSLLYGHLERKNSTSSDNVQYPQSISNTGKGEDE